MGFFSTLFGLDENQKAAILSEVNLFDCVSVHMKWKVRLQGCLDGTSEEQLDPDVVSRDDQCALGKWIQGPALNHFHDDEDFRKLRAHHAHFHFIAGNVVKKIQANDKVGANALMQNEYAHASRDVIHDITELNKHLATQQP